MGLLPYIKANIGQHMHRGNRQLRLAAIGMEASALKAGVVGW